MNMLTFDKLKELFLEKNPKGNLYYKSDKLEVCFTEGGKMYSYKVKNNCEAANKLKLGIKVLYKRDYEAFVRMINTQKENIERGYHENYFFEGDEKINYTETEIENMKFDIKCMEEKIKDVWIV